MDTQIFENMLNKYYRGDANAEAMWDMRAKSFGKGHKIGGMNHAKEVTEVLLEKGLLKEQEILDVGGGTGRYAIPFAVYAKEVTMADISSQMLEAAKRNAQQAGRDNLSYVKLNWDHADLRELGWEKRFDLVFASMSEAYRSKEGLEKMCVASRGWCQINQMTEMKDSVSEKLFADLELARNSDVHNNREITQAIFNLLWLMGYDPEITYLKDSSQQTLSLDEAVSDYSFRFGKAAAEKGIQLRELLGKYSDGETISVENRTTLSMIRWKI